MQAACVKRVCSRDMPGRQGVLHAPALVEQTFRASLRGSGRVQCRGHTVLTYASRVLIGALSSHALCSEPISRVVLAHLQHGKGGIACAVRTSWTCLMWAADMRLVASMSSSCRGATVRTRQQRYTQKSRAPWTPCGPLGSPAHAVLRWHATRAGFGHRRR